MQTTNFVAMQLSKKGTTALGRFGPEEAHQGDMSHAHKLALLAYSKRAHSEWALLDKQEAQTEQTDAQQRKTHLAELKASCCLFQCCLSLELHQAPYCNRSLIS